MEYKLGQKVKHNGYEATVHAILRTTWEDVNGTAGFRTEYVVKYQIDGIEVFKTVSRRILDQHPAQFKPQA